MKEKMSSERPPTSESKKGQAVANRGSESEFEEIENGRNSPDEKKQDELAFAGSKPGEYAHAQGRPLKIG